MSKLAQDVTRMVKDMGEQQMRRHKTAGKRAPAGRRVKAAKARVIKAKTARSRKGGGAQNGAAQRAYRLANRALPDTPREGTFGRAILESIKAHAPATEAVIMGDVKGASPLTVRKYLAMFVQAKIATASAQEAR